MADYFRNIKQSIKELCAIESVQTSAEGAKPFGDGVFRALEYVLNLGKSLGFETVNYDNYIGEIIWRGAPDEKTMGILCHVDVVKPGRLTDWKYPPFCPTEEDGKIYARGALDDKGPAACVLWLMKELKDEGFIPKKTIKLIIGCNEESGWGCIDHYKKVAKMPDFGFSPDGDFPVLYAEKGIMHAKFRFSKKAALQEARGGDMPNVVCDYAYAVAPADDKIAKECGVKIDGNKIESYGIAAHGSTPEKGKNAIDGLLKYLVKTGAADEYAYDALFGDKYGLKKYNDETGYLTMSPDVIATDDKYMYITVDFRYPATFKGEFMEKAAEKIAPYTVVNQHQLPLFNDKNGKLVQTLLKIYNEETHSDAVPVAIGGGTYARALPEGAAFGPEMPGEDSPIHQPNEYISLKNLKIMSAIYKRAIKELSE